MHFIQLYILQKLRNGEKTFSQINNDEFRTDIFSYHLKCLISEELIFKTPEGNYKLSDKGLFTIGKYVRDNYQFREKSDSVILIVIANKKYKVPKYLFIKRSTLPFEGQFGFIAGTIDKGKDLDTIIIEKCERAAGVKLLDYEYRYSIRDILHTEGNCILDQTELVFYSEHFKILNNTDRFWFEKKEIDERFTYNSKDVITKIENNTSTLSQKKYELPSIT